MLRHYFKTAVRSLLKRKFYTGTNIFGLAIGLALCLTVLGHISYELSFEDMHLNKDRIFRVEGDYSFEDSTMPTVRVMGPIGEALVAGYPEVEAAAVFRVHQVESIQIGQERSRVINEYEGQGYAHGNKLIFADPTYFDVFSFPLHKGSSTVLSEPNTVLISQEAARYYFESDDPVGQTITINDKIVCQVRGILKDIPQNTQLYTHFIVSYSTLERIGDEINSWSTFGQDFVYLLLKDPTAYKRVEAGIPSLVGQYMGPDEAPKYTFSLRPFKDIYFSIYGSGKYGNMYPAGEISFIYETGAIALFILIIAIANFINLSTARAAERMKEVGVRKVFGAYRSHLVRQYLGESVVIAVVSMLFSVLLYELIKVQSRGVLARDMLVDFYESPVMLAGVVGLIIAVGILAGLYPALYLSRFRPIEILQSRTQMKSSKSVLRKVLVVFQFAIATLFVFCTTVLIRQTNMMSTMELGFDRENVMLLDFDGESAADDCVLVRDQVLTNNRVLSATAVNNPPGRESYTYWAFYTDETRQEDSRIVGRLFAADYDFVSTFGLEVTDGRDFSAREDDEAGRSLLITEETAEELGLAKPVGNRLYRRGGNFYEIIGVVRDFEAAPAGIGFHPSMFIQIRPDLYSSLAIKLPADDIPGSIAAIRQTWENTLPVHQFTYSFLDDEIEASFADQRGESQMFFVLALFAIMIACLGIFGLVSFTSAQRTKEIGIRKVLGASVHGIVKLLSREFVILTAIANVIALPIATIMMNDTLQYFPEKVTMGVGTYAFVMAIVIAVALGTTSLQSLKAAHADPVDALRCE